MADDSESSGRRKKHAGAKWLLFGCGGLFAVGLSAGFGYLAWANSPLPPPDPEPPLPSPNGRDVCVAAFSNRPLPPKDWPLEKPDTAPLAVVRREVARPDPGAEKVRGALSMEYGNPFLRDVGGTYPEISHFRPLAKRWTAEARVARTEGKPVVAFDRCLDSMELGSRIPHGGGIVFNLIGVACQTTPLQQAELSIPDLSANAARNAGKRLDRIIRQCPPATEFMEIERLSTLGWVRAYFHGRADAFKAAGLGNSGMDHPLVLALYPKRWSYESIDAYYKACIKELSKPYLARSQPETPRDPIGVMLLPALSTTSSRITEGRACLHLLRLELALHEYHSVHRVYPAKLEQLAPRFLSKIPHDPFSEKPYPYRLKGKGYLLYSLGYDGKDDGGSPIAKRKTSVGGAGDLVAGQLWPGN